MNRLKQAFLAGCCLAGFVPLVHAGDVSEERNIGLELAKDIAWAAVEECRKDGWAVSGVVVDRHGLVRAALRDDKATRFTTEIAERKANVSILSGLKSGAFRAARKDIQQELNHIEGLVVMEGGVPIVVEGVRMGAIGVSGAPGGEKDEACALRALERMNDRLEMPN
jgi:uncharacterized protein GlcG (DUF336 family)